MKIINIEEYIQEEYESACRVKSDINEHLPVLFNLASVCPRVTEFGVRTGVSTRAFLNHRQIKLRSYDLHIDHSVEKLFSMCREIGRDVQYIQGDSLKVEIEKTDLLFIDTDHTYKQLYKELSLHSSYVEKYIVIHDTDLPYGQELLAAIMDFLVGTNNSWRVSYHTRINHGLTILARNNKG